MSEETKPRINQEVMDYLRLWHERMAHANLKAVVILGRRGDAGETPEGLPKGPEDRFEGLQPYMDQLNCDTCKEIYGDSSGPASCCRNLAAPGDKRSAAATAPGDPLLGQPAAT
ncbi:hypothetical protein F5Y03DRAFT_397637 [Xylaria venustula]|nr:hypothetical protein F5Y03DRAFT_397637 [Xylaria venustula]